MLDQRRPLLLVWVISLVTGVLAVTQFFLSKPVPPELEFYSGTPHAVFVGEDLPDDAVFAFRLTSMPREFYVTGGLWGVGRIRQDVMMGERVRVWVDREELQVTGAGQVWRLEIGGEPVLTEGQVARREHKGSWLLIFAAVLAFSCTIAARIKLAKQNHQMRQLRLLRIAMAEDADSESDDDAEKSLPDNPAERWQRTAAKGQS